MDYNLRVKVAADIADFSRNLRKVSDSVAGLGKGFTGMGDRARRLASGIKEIAVSAGLLALGYKAINMINQSLDGAIDRYDTLNNFPRVMQQIGFDAAESSKAINRLSDGIQGLPTTLDSVAKTAQRLAVMTGDLDGAVETTLALNNAFLASGASSADAARGLEQYVQMLSTGTVDLQSWRTLQETMGVALNEVAEAFGFAGASAQNDLYKALRDGKITFDEFNAKLIELSNTTGGFAERALTATGGIKTSWQNVKTAVVAGVTEVIGAIDEALGGTGSIASMFDNLKVGIRGFFSTVAGAIPKVAAGFAVVKSAIEPLMPTIQNVVDTIQGKLATGIEFAKGVFASLVEFWNQNGATILENAKIYFGGVWETLQTVFSAIHTVVQDVLGSRVIPFIKEQLAGLSQFWQENGEQIMQAVQNAFQFIQSVVQFVMPIVKFIIEIVWSAIQDIISGALNVIKGAVQVFTAIFTGDWQQLWEGIKKILSGAVQFILGIMSLNFLGNIKNVFKNLLTNGVNIIKNMWTAIVNFFKGASANSTNIVMSLVSRVVGFFRNLLTNGTNIFRNLLNVIRNNMNSVRTVIVNTWDRVISFLKGINLKDIGRQIIRGLINGIGSMASAVVDKVKEIGNSITSGFKSLLGIRSPSRVMMDLARYIPLGIIRGIESMESKVKRVTNDLAEWATPDIPSVAIAYSTPSGTYGSLRSAISDTIDVNTKDDQLLQAINRLERKMTNLRVYMDGREVGWIVEPHVTERQEFKAARRRDFRV